MTVVLGGGVVRESATSLTSGSQKPIGSHLLHQPPCWFGELRRTSPPSLRLLFHAKCRRKKKAGARARCASGYRMLAGPRGRRAATGASVGLPVLCGAARPPRSSRSLAGNTAGLVRALAPPSRACGVDPQSFRSLPRARQRCGSAWFCAAPPISGEQPLGALAAEGRERATDRRAWPVVREDTRGRVECIVRGSFTCFSR